MGKPLTSILLLMLILVYLAACSPAAEATVSPMPTVNPAPAYSLDWIIAEGEAVAYQTVMNTLDSGFSEISAGDNSLSSESDEASLTVLQQQFEALAESFPQVTSLVSILNRNARGNITVRIIVDRIETPETQPDDGLGTAFSQFAAGMEGTVQLRGELTPNGEIASFYLASRQRNLLAILFELPTTPVRVGDSWELDVNCIELGSGFIADTADKKNQVTFAALSQTADNKPLAILDYLISENVAGNVESLMLSAATPIPASMSCSFVGQGEFLIEEGRWQRLTGLFSITSDGMMVANTTQHFALSLLGEVPAAYIGFE